MTKPISPTAQRVWQIVEQIPLGQTMSYKEIATLVKTGPRAIGRILHNNPDPQKYPCHRVIKSDGTLAEGYAFGGKSAQLQKLINEGVSIESLA